MIEITTSLWDRMNLARLTKYDHFEEIAVSDCPSGCKVYASKNTGEKYLVHNYTYGCRK